MERLTVMHGGMMVPRKACTFDREEVADETWDSSEIDFDKVYKLCKQIANLPERK